MTRRVVLELRVIADPHGIHVAPVVSLQGESCRSSQGYLAETGAGRQLGNPPSARSAKSRESEVETLIESSARPLTHSERLSHDLHTIQRHRLLRGAEPNGGGDDVSRRPST